MKKTNFEKKKGFTLIEMLLAIAILVVLSSAILVSVSSQRDKARVTRMLSDMSSVIQPIEMCLADGGTVSSPSYGANICNLSANYGKWPLSMDGFATYGLSGSFTSNNWYFYRRHTNGTYVCCSASLIGCDTGTTLATACY